MQVVLQGMEQLWYVLLTGFPLVLECVGFFQLFKDVKTKSSKVLEPVADRRSIMHRQCLINYS